MVKFSFPKLLLQKKKTNLAILSMVLRYTQVMHKNIERELFIPYPISPTTSVFHLSPLWTECTYAVLHSISNAELIIFSLQTGSFSNYCCL